MVVHSARGLWGRTGILGSAAVLGLTDVDALTTSMARSVAYSASITVAAQAIAVGILANTLMKFALAWFLGSGRFRMIAGLTVFLMFLVAAAALAVL